MEWSHNTVALVAGHAGRVVSIAFSPLLPDTILVVGGCGFVVWRCASNAGAPGGGADGRAGGGEGGGNSTASVEAKEEAAGSAQKAALVPVFESPFPPALYTCGCWSNTKPGARVWGVVPAALLRILSCCSSSSALPSSHRPPACRTLTHAPTLCTPHQEPSCWGGRMGGWRPGTY